MLKNASLLLLCFMGLAACGEATEPAMNDSSTSLVVMSQDLQQLKDDFNDNTGRVRLLFLSGPTCGICLRGMADLNDEFIAASQNDDRLVTLVVHVPTMGALEHHAVDSMPLLDGPRVHHYWEGSGIIGQHYSETMNVEIYVWDFWTIYGPDAVWDETLPPVPDYYEHQLASTSGKFSVFPRELMLDAERFAAATQKYLNQVDTRRFAAKGVLKPPESERFADGTVIPVVGQPRSFVVRQHIMGRGGYKNLKRIQSIEAHGRIEISGQSQALVISSERPNTVRRTIGTGAGPVLPAGLDQILRDVFEFDGFLVEWPQKGHELSKVGMLKIGEVLAWKLDLLKSDGAHWHLYLDSHTGGVMQASLLDNSNEPTLVIRQSDFRETSGFTFPHRIEYLDGAGKRLAVETIDDLKLEVIPLSLSESL